MPDSAPPIPQDLKTMAQPYIDGKKMPDATFALIMRVALREQEAAAKRPKMKQAFPKPKDIRRKRESVHVYCDAQGKVDGK